MKQAYKLHPAWILWLSPVAIVLSIILSVRFGSKTIDAGTLWEAFANFDSGNVNHQIVMHSRVPRAIGALLIGAFLAMSGALMQGMTRNYLASPSIMGVTDGSVFAITVCMIALPGSSSIEMIVYSFIGSAFGVGLVFGLASLLPGGMSPVRLAVTGTVIGTFLGSMATAFSTYFQVSQKIGFWYNARLHQMDPNLIKLAIPFAVVGVALALLISKSVSILSLGEEVAVSLGQRTLLVKVVAMLAVILLTGVSVALAGKVAFVGLIVPHITRFLVGLDYRWIVPCAGVLGGVFLALCDVASRFMNYPFEMPIGVVTSLIGVPFFLYLIRKKGGEQRA